MQVLLITGTDTDVGKTVLTASLTAYWLKYISASSLGLIKLMQAGVGDLELYQQLFPSLEIVVPLSFDTPVAPPIAAVKEGKKVELQPVWQALYSLQQKRDFVLAEALGGLGSPVTEELTVADIARDWHLPIVLVVPVKLGAISQAVANIALARQSNLTVQGIVLSCTTPESEGKLSDWAPIELIQALTNVPVLGVIPHLSDLTDLDKLARIASDLELEKLMPVSC
jgi:dethiobiotin synthetase